MTEIDFIDKVKCISKDSKNLIYNDGGYTIQRGMAHSISGHVEDLFALYVAKKINSTELTYYVDKVISFREMDGSKAISFKPDLMIVNNENVMTHYFDLKTDLGWNRYLKDYVTKKHNFIEKLKQRNKAWINLKNQKARDVVVSDTLKYHMVVVYGGNINAKTMQENNQIVMALDNVKLDVLYHDIEGKGFEVDHTSFKNIHTSIIETI
ncbi:hypothetical protein [Kriegella aquimaris]|uniref:Uncharacterized protein n=1 Tax=Kriegella aquimaris TaxID=192904 RepID=A0A1G9V267_9FLAO|nr:hypothetical protein [Kriegella aquimaris]SDM65975.1 hypothetical protein SAMN04488514_11271 [Kriegella aquimaris]